MVKHNNVVPNAHFRKQWQRRVKTWFSQPLQKKARREARAARVAKMAPRPAHLLRPVVRCQTQRYNMRVRAGRGFTLEELKAAGVSKYEARNIGIAVDHRRRNKSEESLRANTARLQAYMARLVVKTNAGAKKWAQDKAGRSAALAEFAAGKDAGVAGEGKAVLAIGSGRSDKVEFQPLTDDMKSTMAFRALRQAWVDQKMGGIRAKRAEDAEKKAAAKKKKGKK